MLRARMTGLWYGLFATAWLAGSDSAAAGRVEEGALAAPSPSISSPELLVDADHAVQVAGQILWCDPATVHVYGLVPLALLAVDVKTGIVQELARPGPGPFEVDGPVALMGRGRTSNELILHQPARRASICFTRGRVPALLRHEFAVTAAVFDGGPGVGSGTGPGTRPGTAPGIGPGTSVAAGTTAAWWLGPVLAGPDGPAPARVELWRGASPEPDAGAVHVRAPDSTVWSASHGGEREEQLMAQYFTRLLPAPDGQLWRVVLGLHPRADLVHPLTGESRQLEIAANEGAWIEATVDRRGVLHVLAAGGPGSSGRRILRFDPGPLPVIEADRAFSGGAVSPDGRRWVAVEADTGDLLIYKMPGAELPEVEAAPGPEAPATSSVRTPSASK